MNTARNALSGACTVLLLTFAILLYPAADAEARTREVKNIENVPVPAGLDLKTVGDAIVDGCAVRNWVAMEVEPGHMQCQLYLRTHMAKVDIRYDTSTFSITYADSENLKYDAAKNRIHRNYNSWVENLSGDIRNELLKASR